MAEPALDDVLADFELMDFYEVSIRRRAHWTARYQGRAIRPRKRQRSGEDRPYRDNIALTASGDSMREVLLTLHGHALETRAAHLAARVLPDASS